MGSRPGLRRSELAGRPRSGERGSAIILVLLIAVVLTLLGISFLWMAETEVRIADNERLSQQALYFTESTARVVKRWFDSPLTGLHFPPMNVVDRSLRLVDTDGAGPNVAVAAGGGVPIWKEGVDLDGDTDDDIFQAPYRGSQAHSLLGTETGPDLRIDRDASTQAATFLDQLSASIAPDLTSGSFRPRILRIDVFAPPYVDDGGSWVRYGVGTVRVTAGLFRGAAGSERLVARRTVRFVVNETPYLGPFGPLHSCRQLDWDSDFGAHWGAATAMQTSALPAVGDLDESVPRSVPSSPSIDSVWGFASPPLSTYKLGNTAALDDPWFRVIAGGSIGVAPNVQPYPSPWNGATGTPNAQDHSNLFQGMAFVGCPIYEYDIWKTIAASGYSDVRYFSWDGSQYRENGRGVPGSFQSLTDGETGVFFFDTVDGLAPRDDDADTFYDNLAPAITVNGNWDFRGLIYVNAESISISGGGGATASIRAPGEPFHDTGGVFGQWDSGETYLNLDYPGTLAGTIRLDPTDTLQDPGFSGSTPMRNRMGPAFNATVNLNGVLFTNGEFVSRGTATHYGSVIARQGVTQAGGAAGRPEIYFDASLLDDWPPAAWNMPRVVVTRWATEP